VLAELVSAADDNAFLVHSENIHDMHISVTEMLTSFFDEKSWARGPLLFLRSSFLEMESLSKKKKAWLSPMHIF